MDDLNRKELIQRLVNLVRLENGVIEIKVQDGSWTYVRFVTGYNRNEHKELENISFKNISERG